MQTEKWPSMAKTDPPPPYAHLTMSAIHETSTLSTCVRKAFEDAMAMRAKLPPQAFSVQGFSGKKFRCFMNNLMREVPDPRYLEIGLFHGASFCSALAGNRVSAVGIDNWTEYGGQRAKFDDNFTRFRTPESDVKILEKDFRAVDYTAVGKFNVIFYDGSHAEKDQYDGVYLPQPALDNQHILVVDDWNWVRVRNGTLNAVRDAGLSLDYTVEVRTSFHDEHLPVINGGNSEWHNGCFVGVLTRRG